MASSINASTSGAGGVITTADNSGILNLQSAGTTVATIQPSGLSLPTGSTINTANTFGFKNRIINGAMVIDQRNAGASSSAVNGTYYLDRWAVNSYNGGATTGIYTIQQNAGSVTPPIGFTNYVGITSSATTTYGANGIYAIWQFIEGFNTADLGWGTANAKTVTISFWVRSSLTGTFGGSVGNASYNRSYPFSYTISSANTWEQKSVTIAGDTTGTWATNNTTGIQLYFGFGVGSNYTATAGAWTASQTHSCTGATSVVGTNGATFYLTGVQLEIGSQATSFDFRSITQETVLCQRYFEKTTTSMYGSIANVGYLIWFFKVSKRASPTIVYAAGTLGTNQNTNVDSTDLYNNGYPYMMVGTTASAEL